MAKKNFRLDTLLSHLSGGERDILGLVAKRKPLEEIAERVGLTPDQIRERVHDARFAFGANDDLVDDYLRLLDEWETATGDGILVDHVNDIAAKARNNTPSDSERKLKTLEEIERTCTPDEMRGLASSLMKLADAIDQDWRPENVSGDYHWPTTAARIEQNSLELAKRATLLLKQAKMREKYLPPELIGEPVWNILLDLFIQFSGGAKVSSKSLWIAADCPATSALRYIKRLESLGLIERHEMKSDGRVSLYGLTKRGLVAVGCTLERMRI